MTNEDRQKSIEKSLLKEFGQLKCGERIFCDFCKHEKENACAKAYNRMTYKEQFKTTTERDKYSWRN